MAWSDVVEPRTLRECRIALGKSQAAFAALLGVSAESYRTWDAGRRATPPLVMVRARVIATHRDDHALLPLPVLALLIGVHVKTLRAAARDGRLPVTFDTRTRGLRSADSSASAGARRQPGAVRGHDWRRRQGRRLSVGSAETVPLPRVLVSHHGPEPGASGRCENGRTVSPAA